MIAQLLLPLLPFLMLGVAEPATQPTDAARVQVIEVAPVWAGHRVGFALLTDGDDQFVAYYDANRQMTLAQRKLGSGDWTFKQLPTSVGWDSHNYITMALDKKGQLHVAGNMHNVPMIYFRTQTPRDIRTIEKIDAMVGADESRMTYPRFLRSADGELIYNYRDGGSGNGVWVYNIYDADSEQWRRLLDTPLLASVGRGGQGTLNAYPQGPVLGPDGRFHLVWCWRDTPDAATNHDVSYARSDDLLNWERSDGTPLTLPITIDDAEVIDPVPAGWGMINSNLRLAFDDQQRPIVSYHKFDDAGNTQVINARLEDDGWQTYQATNWDKRWDFGGNGSLVNDVSVAGVQVRADGSLAQSIRYFDKNGTWLLDPETLAVTGPAPRVGPKPLPIPVPRSGVEGMEMNSASDLGGDRGDTLYRLRWETLPANRDQPRAGDPPAPTMLYVIEAPRLTGS